MDVIKRSWLYITRKKKKSIIMLFILFAISTAILSGISIKKATVISNENASKSLANFFNLSANIGNTSEQGISRNAINEVLKLKEIKNYNAISSGAGDNETLKKVKPTKETNYSYDGIEDSFILNGNDNTEYDLKFTNNMLKLVEGRHITSKDKNKVLVHKDFAKLNNLKIGDKLTFKKVNGIDYKIIDGKGKEEITLEIVGIFDKGSKDLESEGTYLEIPENNLLCDNNSLKEFYGFSDTDNIYDSATFHVDKNTSVDSVIAKAKDLPINWNLIRVNKSDEIFLSLAKSFEAMNKIVNMMLIGSIIIGACVLSLILTFWIQGRIHETGILLSIGISKVKIISQYVIELLLISVLAFSLSYFAGQFISQQVGESLMQKASTETVQQLKNEAGMPLGNDLQTKMLTHTSNDIDVKITPKEMASMWGIGSLVIISSVVISSAPIIRLKPKEILSKMS